MRRGWYVYDWAVSGFTTVVAAVFFGPYLTDVARRAADGAGYVYLLDVPIRAAAVFPYTVSFSVALQVAVVPLVGHVTDRTGRDRAVLGALAAFGAAATCLMALVTASFIAGC